MLVSSVHSSRLAMIGLFLKNYSLWFENALIQRRNGYEYLIHCREFSDAITTVQRNLQWRR